MRYILRACERPGAGSLGITFEVDLPMRIFTGETFEHTLQEEPWPKEWEWLNGEFWRVDRIIHRKRDGEYIPELLISPPLSK